MTKSKKRQTQGDKKQQILKAAVRCFQRNGVIGTTFSEIALEAKVHQPLIGYHFPTFEDLFSAVVQVLLEDLRQMSVEAIAAHPSDPEQALIDYIFVPLRWTESRPEYTSLWTFFYHLTTYQDRFCQLNQQIRNVGRERISLLLYRYQEEKKLELRSPWTIDELAWAVQTQITGALTMAVTEKANPERAARICQETVRALLRQVF